MALRARALPARLFAPPQRHAPRRGACTRCAAGSVTVVGLGPGAGGLLTREAWDVLTTARGAVYVRTLEHPTLRELPGSVELRSFDDVYESSATLQDVYPQITERLLAAAAGGEAVVYAVPGDPCIAEMTVRLLRERAAASGVQLRVLSAVSFLEPLLAALGVDVLPSLWVGDALDVAAAGHPPFGAGTPALLTQLYSRAVASEVKLTLMGALPDEHAVALVHAAGDGGGGEASVEWLPLHAIDRSDAIGARTSLYVPPWAARGAEGEEAEAAAACGSGVPSFEAVLSGVAAARDALEGPWREGDPAHADVAPGLLRAASAAAKAADAGDARALRAALADVLLAVATHAQVAADEGEWAARHVLAEAAAKADALSGDTAGAGQQPRAPEGRGYALDEEDDGSDGDE